MARGMLPSIPGRMPAAPRSVAPWGEPPAQPKRGGVAGLYSGGMARSTAPSPAKPAKEPGRMKQLWQVLRMTVRADRAALWLMLAGLVLPIVASVVLAITLSADNVIGAVLWVITGVLAGILLFLIVLGRRAERVAYRQISGQPGAVGAVLKSSLRRAWQARTRPPFGM